MLSDLQAILVLVFGSAGIGCLIMYWFNNRKPETSRQDRIDNNIKATNGTVDKAPVNTGATTDIENKIDSLKGKAENVKESIEKKEEGIKVISEHTEPVKPIEDPQGAANWVNDITGGKK